MLKKQNLLFLLISSIILMGCSKKTVDLKELSEIDGIFLLNKTGKPFTGVAEEKSENGTKKLTVNFKKGKIDGEMKAYYEDGNVEFERNFKNGEETGEIKEYYPNRQAMVEGYLLNGQQDGKWIFYYENGQKLLEAEFKNGLENGTFKEFYENGELKEESRYEDGVLTGEPISYPNSATEPFETEAEAVQGDIE